MTVLALDLGTTTGWAIQYEDGRIESGYVSFKPKKNDGYGVRYIKFQKWLEIEFGGIVDKVCFEMVRGHTGVNASHIYGGWLAYLSAWCEINRVQLDFVEVKTLKKFATGNGNAGKPEMIAAAQVAGFDVTDDNQADAIHLLRYAISNKG